MKLLNLSDTGIAVCTFFATVGSLLVGLLGGWDSLAVVFIAMIVLDYATGVIAAIYEKKLSSAIGFKGICKKIMMILLVFAVVYISKVVQVEGLRALCLMFFIANEGISILENAGKLGVPYPKIIKRVLEQLKQENEDIK